MRIYVLAPIDVLLNCHWPALVDIRMPKNTVASFSRGVRVSLLAIPVIL